NSLLPCAPRVLAATLARRTHDSSCKRPAELTAPMLSLSVPYYRSKTKIENDLFDIPDGQSGQVKSGQPAWNEARESEAMRGRSNFVAAMGVVAAAMLASGGSAFAQKKYDAGASDTEIKIGNTGPYSGPNSIASSIPKTMAAYFKKINAEGGINGRKIDFISYDDAFSPPKSVEQVRKLVEGDEVLAVFGTMGTAVNTAIEKYLNQKQVPQLFVIAGASKFNDPQTFPWTMGWQPTYKIEAQIYAKYLLKEKPDAKIAVFY